MRFRTRTQEVEAIQYTGDNAAEVMSICTTASAHSDGKGNEWIEILDRFKQRMQVHDPAILVHTDDKPAGWFVADREWFEETFVAAPVPDLIRTVADYEGLPDGTILQVEATEQDETHEIQPGNVVQVEASANGCWLTGYLIEVSAEVFVQSGVVCSVVRLGGDG